MPRGQHIRPVRRCCFQDGTRKARKNTLKLIRSASATIPLFDGEQRIGRIRFADERMPGVWLWNVVIHLTRDLPMGSSRHLDTAKAEFKAAGEALKARTSPEDLAAAYKTLNIRDDG
jgi:hypothetical protein